MSHNLFDPGLHCQLPKQDGKMSFEEFCGHKSRYELAFEAIDKNGDGFVSKSEFKKICPNLTPEQTEAAFAKFDLVSSLRRFDA